MGSAGMLVLVRKRIGDPQVREVVHGLLNSFRRQVFTDSGSGFEHHHRVTLFRHKEWGWVWRRWPWNGWLIPELRSGETTRNPSCRFRASSDDPDRAEGIAGMAWVSDRDIYVHSLPGVGQVNATDTDLSTYASETGMQVAEIRAMKPKARSFYGIRVEVAKGRWGVIVIDSAHATLKQKTVESSYARIAPSLSVLLTRI